MIPRLIICLLKGISFDGNDCDVPDLEITTFLDVFEGASESSDDGGPDGEIQSIQGAHAGAPTLD